MNAVLLLVVAIGCAGVTSARADSATTSDQNASLRLTRDEPTANLGVPNDPIQLPRTIEWTVDGRRILVYPIYHQGNSQTGSLTAAPFAPLTVLPVVSFTGFNPLLNQNLNLPAGATLTMVTALKVERAPLLTLVGWVLLVAVVALGAAALALRRRGRDR